MNEIKVIAPKGKAKQVAKLAHDAGIKEVSTFTVFVHGPNEERDQIDMEVSVPQARAFIDKLLTAPFYDANDYSVSSDELLTIVSSEPPEKISRPMRLEAPTVLQDLWVQNHITISYVTRAFVSALLLSYGLMDGDMLTMMAAFLFTPFLAQDLAIGFGLLTREWRLARQGVLAMSTSTVLTVLAGVIVAAIMGGQMQYDQFGTLYSNFAISLVVGFVAGLDMADKSGRREFIAVAAAAQFATFPAWFGISLVLGFPDSETTMWRIVTFFVNILTILLVGIGAFALMRYRPELISKYLADTRATS